MSDIIKVCKKHGPLTKDLIKIQKQRRPFRDHPLSVTCRLCFREAALKSYYKHKEERSKSMKAYRKKNPDHETNRKLKKYNITTFEYELMIKKQNGKCAICLKSETFINPVSKKVQKLSVDHCHKTKKIRGLLCQFCNAGLGRFKDSILIINYAAEYLKKHK